jgi:hypothetical protein
MLPGETMERFLIRKHKKILVGISIVGHSPFMKLDCCFKLHVATSPGCVSWGTDYSAILDNVANDG